MNIQTPNVHTPQTPTILIVDDVPANLFAMREILKHIDANIVEANNGNEALAATLQYDFALVLLDVQMPEISGYEVAELMRSAEHSRHTPIIFVSANSREEVHEMKGYNAGAVDYITKPINKNILRSKVNVFCDLYRSQAQIKLMMRGLEEKFFEKTRMEKQLSEYNAKLEVAQCDAVIARLDAEKNASLKTEFLSNMSHELRTPMHAILSYANLGLKNIDKPDTEKLTKYLSNIHSAGTRLLGLLNDLLDLSKLEARKMDFTRTPQDVMAVMEQALLEMDTILREKNIRLCIDRQADDTIASFDASAVIRVFINLLSNAIKFSPEDAPLYIRFNKTDEHLVCSIEDSGVGIPSGELQAVFDKFIQSSKTKNSAGGTGLGLAICKEIIVAHNGNIWAENKPDSGAVFRFTLPLHA